MSTGIKTIISKNMNSENYKAELDKNTTSSAFLSTFQLKTFTYKKCVESLNKQQSYL